MRHTKPSAPSWRTVIRWPLFLLANAALLCIIGVSTAREMYRGWTVDREIQALEAQAASLEGRKSALESLTKELVSADRIDYEARARLGKKKPGERVIVIEGIAASTTWSVNEGSVATVVAPKADSADNVSNPQKWRAYFFKSSH